MDAPGPLSPSRSTRSITSEPELSPEDDVSLSLESSLLESDESLSSLSSLLSSSESVGGGSLDGGASSSLSSSFVLRTNSSTTVSSGFSKADSIASRSQPSARSSRRSRFSRSLARRRRLSSARSMSSCSGTPSLADGRHPRILRFAAAIASRSCAIRFAAMACGSLLSSTLDASTVDWSFSFSALSFASLSLLDLSSFAYLSFCVRSLSCTRSSISLSTDALAALSDSTSPAVAFSTLRLSASAASLSDFSCALVSSLTRSHSRLTSADAALRSAWASLRASARPACHFLFTRTETTASDAARSCSETFSVSSTHWSRYDAGVICASTFCARSPNLRVQSVSCMFGESGRIVTMIDVRPLPERECCSTRVSFESRNATTFSPATSAAMQLPSVVKDLLIATASLYASPVTPDLDTRSDPARSIRYRRPIVDSPVSRFLRCTSVMRHACERDDAEFILVFATARLPSPSAMRSIDSLYDVTSRVVTFSIVAPVSSTRTTRLSLEISSKSCTLSRYSCTYCCFTTTSYLALSFAIFSKRNWMQRGWMPSSPGVVHPSEKVFPVPVCP
mmetsp:Transcript_49647/g.153337  ORF Transcript_49647/g.153337 Transcript_49647/m.153337 type:complete len:566 (-) Transcript_49647:332-2029(-)